MIRCGGRGAEHSRRRRHGRTKDGALARTGRRGVPRDASAYFVCCALAAKRAGVSLRRGRNTGKLNEVLVCRFAALRSLLCNVCHSVHVCTIIPCALPQYVVFVLILACRTKWTRCHHHCGNRTGPYVRACSRDCLAGVCGRPVRTARGATKTHLR